VTTVRLPVIQGARGSILSDGRRKKIVPADVRGHFARARSVTFFLLIVVWIALPWATINGAPAVFLDEEARRFYLFGATFNAQDTWLLFFLLSGVGFGLVYVTALTGRAWCGWACPQTVFLEGVYRRIERLIEGPRDKHFRRDAGPWSFGRLARKVAKHGAFVLASLAVAHIVLAYFVSLPRAFAMVRHAPAAHLEAFVWVMSITALLYGNFAWFREQLCVVLCPYGRLQSVMLDEDSLVVGYDAERGEPRGKKGKAEGDCVDCGRCVVVCPTGIDIRDGLQLDCIACTACVDACDEVMDRMARPRGLVRYDSPNGLAGRKRRFVRPRLVLYTVLLVVGGAVAALATRARTDFEATVSRLPGAPYTLDGASIRNALDLHLVNKRGDAQTFDIRVEGPSTIEAIVPVARITVESLRDAHVPLFLTMQRGDFHSDTPAGIRVVREGTQERDAAVVAVTFLGAVR
jgi:cytochrome c oxidase accessory protein FixG